jgi:hypothetical protein
VVGVADHKIYTRDSLTEHVVYSIGSAAAHTNNFDDGGIVFAGHFERKHIFWIG